MLVYLRDGSAWKTVHAATLRCRSNSLSYSVITEGRISSLVVCWLAVLLDAASWVRSSSGENVSGGEDFPFGVNIGSDAIPHKESVNRGLVCAHVHSISRTQKILTFMS